jgi:hypothetical protein
VTNTAGRRRSGAKSSQPATSKSLSRAERGRRKKREQRPAQTKKRDAEGIYRPTPHEQSALRRYLTLTENTAPRLKVLTDGDVPQLVYDHPDQAVARVLVQGALGTADADFMDGLLRQLANASSDGAVSERGVSFMLSIIKGVQPNDQLEAMLAAQMAAIHMATMTFARRLARVESIPQQDSAERALNKLARTYAMQMEALKRYRTGGEQKVTVQHVSVSEGGKQLSAT